jgi:ribosomal protein S18 acetylase RimI-like enzyme
MNDDLAIRSATPADIPALAALATEAFRVAYSAFDDPAEIEDYVAGAFTTAKFERILAQENSTLLVATVDKTLSGYVQLAPTTPPPCVTGPAPVELVRLYLDPRTIGRGFGAALMRAALRAAEHDGWRTIWLGLHYRNQRARDFYRRCGFADVGTREFVFGGRAYDDPVMAMALAHDGDDMR